MNTAVHVVATMITDAYIGETAMHHHYVGGDVERIRQLRCTPDEYSGEIVTVHDVNHDSAWSHVKNCRAWPMVDLWARVSKELTKADRHIEAKRVLNLAAQYDGSVGW